MRFFVVLLAVVFCKKMIITKKYTDYLKRTVDWEVVDYEDNIFRSWTVDEFKDILGYKSFDDFKISEPDPVKDKLAPQSIDWTKNKCNHGVRDQGNCGSDWAFATVDMISYRCCAATGNKGPLSPQELVSCDKNNHGCQGGYLDKPMSYIKNLGLVPESCFHYTGKKSPCPNECHDGSGWKKAHVCRCKEYKTCPGGAGVKECLSKGPVTFGFRVPRSFLSYKSGIYRCTGESYIGGHAVIAMGHKESDAAAGGHFIVKNSWGVNWGDKGYFKLAFGSCEIRGGVICTDF